VLREGEAATITLPYSSLEPRSLRLSLSSQRAGRLFCEIPLQGLILEYRSVSHETNGHSHYFSSYL
jgi:hypothetical protein